MNPNSHTRATNHKCKLQNGSIVNFDASNSEANIAPHGNKYKSLGFGEYHSVCVNGETITMTGVRNAYFFKLIKSRNAKK
jgi:hypothetical protein